MLWSAFGQRKAAAFAPPERHHAKSNLAHFQPSFLVQLAKRSSFFSLLARARPLARRRSALEESIFVAGGGLHAKMFRENIPRAEGRLRLSAGLAIARGLSSNSVVFHGTSQNRSWPISKSNYSSYVACERLFFLRSHAACVDLIARLGRFPGRTLLCSFPSWGLCPTADSNPSRRNMASANGRLSASAGTRRPERVQRLDRRRFENVGQRARVRRGWVGLSADFQNNMHFFLSLDEKKKIPTKKKIYK